VSGRIFCLDDRRKQLWEYNTYGKIYNSIINDRDLIITMTKEGDIHTINANTGDLFQVIGIGDIVTSDFNLIDISYNDMKTKGIVFGTASGDVYCYELYSLEMVWSNNISEFNITSRPMKSNNKIIFQDSDENYYCINSGNGILVWKWKADVKSANRLFRSSMNCNNNLVFVTDSDGDVHSIDILLGTENWIKKKAAASGKIFYSRLSSSLFVHTNKNKIVELEESNGRVLSEIKLSKECQDAIPSAWIETDSELIIGFDNGLIAEIDQNKNFTELLITGNAPIISITKTGEKEHVTNNLDGKITKFTLP
jgi:outer membrane protein assembly factor BamB